MRKTSPASKIDRIYLHYGLTQIVNEPTHFTKYSNSLIDLLLASSSHCVVFSERTRDKMPLSNILLFTS